MCSVKIFIGIDDTDNRNSPGSGTVAEKLAGELQGRGLAACEGITRHQLFVHEKIPFTSHNSAMCIPAVSHADKLDEVIRFGQQFLQSVSAEGSDPGLCVVVADSHLNGEALISYGRSAKNSILNKQSAYDVAKYLGIHLSEHGGTGDGIIGALAATGLRLYGNDGRYRGWYNLGNIGEMLSVADLCAHDFVDAVVDEQGTMLTDDIPVFIAEERVKTILYNDARVIPVTRSTDENDEPKWMTLTKKQIKRF
jgi:hypothetical protein